MPRTKIVDGMIFIPCILWGLFTGGTSGIVAGFIAYLIFKFIVWFILGLFLPDFSAGRW